MVWMPVALAEFDARTNGERRSWKLFLERLTPLSLRHLVFATSATLLYTKLYQAPPLSRFAEDSHRVAPLIVLVEPGCVLMA